MTTLSVVGLGKLGAPLLAVLADAGFSVIGVDTDEAKVASLNAGKAPVEETDLQAWLQHVYYERVGVGGGWSNEKPRIRQYSATTDLRQAVLDSDATFVIVPTPSGVDGGFTLDYLAPVMEHIGLSLKEKTSYHLVILVSTVMPGQTRECCSILERESGKMEGHDFGLVYSPTMIALGSVIHDLVHPKVAMVGAENDQARDLLLKIYERYIEGKDVRCSTWINCEIAKIADNAFVTNKISFVNDLGRLCEHLPHANVDEVTRIIGDDPRVGSLYFKAGTAYGGPCYPRDSRALEIVFERAGVPKTSTLSLREVVDVTNDAMTDHLWRIVEREAGDEGVVGVLGLAYKPGTSVCEESASLDLIDHLLMNPQRRVVVYDPLAMDEARTALGCAVEYANNNADCCDKADVIVLMHPDFTQVELALMLSKTLIDPWRAMTELSFWCKRYVPLGVGQ